MTEQKRVIPFTEETKAQIIKEQKGKGLILIEEQNHINGNFLVFDTQRPIEPLTIEQRVKTLESKVASLEKCQ